MAVTADDSVAFPVADFMTGFHGLGSFRDMALAAQNTPGIIGIVALSPAFGHDAKVLVQGTTATLVVEYVLVDGFMLIVKSQYRRMAFDICSGLKPYFKSCRTMAHCSMVK